MIELKEFEQKMNELGYKIAEYPDGDLKFYDENDCYGSIGMLVVGRYDLFNLLDSVAVKLIVDFTNTPLKYRVHINKFRVHLFKGNGSYLNVKRANRIVVADSLQSDSYKTMFTELEYSDIRDQVIKDGFYLPEYDESNTTIFKLVEN